MSITLEMLGLTAEQLQELVLARIVDEFSVKIEVDEDGFDYEAQTPFAKAIRAKVKQYIDESVNDLGDQHIKPRVSEMVRDHTIQETSAWGEKRGEPRTFTEYLVERANAYMVEPVNHEGLSESEHKAKNKYGSDWRKHTTRIVYMIDKHLDGHIRAAMEKAINTANSSLAEGLIAACKLKLGEISEKLKVEVKTK